MGLANLAAFPVSHGADYAGMTYRQWLAGIIMAGFGADSNYTGSGGQLAETAVQWADQLIAALSAPTPSGLDLAAEADPEGEE